MTIYGFDGDKDIQYIITGSREYVANTMLALMRSYTVAFTMSREALYETRETKVFREVALWGH